MDQTADPGLRYLIPNQDHLFPQNLCETRRGYHCIAGADHLFLAGRQIASGDILPQWIDPFLQALDEPWTGQLLNRQQNYQRPNHRITGSLEGFVDTYGNFGIQSRLGLEQRPYIMGHMGFFIREMGELNLPFNERRITTRATFEGGLRILSLPFFPVELGGQLTLSAHAGSSVTTYYSANVCSFMRFHFENFSTFGGRSCYLIWSDRSNESSPLSLELFMGLPF